MKPTLLYKCPGNHRGPNGTSYQYKGVSTSLVLGELLESGWFHSLEEAIESAGEKAITKLKPAKKRKEPKLGLPYIPPKVNPIEVIEAPEKTFDEAETKVLEVKVDVINQDINIIEQEDTTEKKERKPRNKKADKE